ncbi:hypothetical protein [Jannaschia aquimarina]|uniref:Uncharacterized protein n=1 Tax=Jannaschia aquimarina TaxID=935700 RepID=A0A0D1EFQ2_9RHOB|nr:hypothetical protein [Jannaschia aquimarina]KIT14700.1 hypothetical protein jaqu_36420 [Jannaschia aquimarina]SNT38328.1 hypothetical protein SAMN05421775_113130 [Jannaschia aquimarina]
MTTLATILAGIILAILVARAWWIMRAEGPGRPRGVDPGKGYTEIESQYFSGLGGGSQMTTRVPKDPQEYARAFVPRKDKQ